MKSRDLPILWILFLLVIAFISAVVVSAILIFGIDGFTSWEYWFEITLLIAGAVATAVLVVGGHIVSIYLEKNS